MGLPTVGAVACFCCAQVHDGIGYLPAAMRNVRLAAARARREGTPVAADGVAREAIALVKQPDIDFTARLASDVDAWLQVRAVQLTGGAGMLAHGTLW